MRSRFETTYGARLGNAQTLLTSLQTEGNYQAMSADLTLEALAELIEAIRTKNSKWAGSKEGYSLSVKRRQDIFEKEPGSIGKSLSPVNASVKAIFGRNSKEARDIAALISKMRGRNIKANKNPDEESVSQSYRSYNSTAQFLSDMIQRLDKLNGYTSQNEVATTASLRDLLTSALAANDDTVKMFTEMKQEHASVMQFYEDLHVMCDRIKESVKAQYGVNSSIYRAIRNLKI